MARNYQNFRDHLLIRLKNKKYAKSFLEGALEDYYQDGDLDALLEFFRLVAEAQGGIGKLSKGTKSTRQTLYKVLSKGGNPSFITLNEVIRNLGFRFSLEFLPKGATKAV